MDVTEDYQQLGDQVDEAAASLKKAKRRARKTPEIAPTLDDAAAAANEVTTPDGVVTAEPETSDDAEQAGHEAGHKGRKGHGGGHRGEGHEGDDGGGHGGGHGTLIDLPTLEALLFTTRHPLTPGRIGELMDIPSSKSLRAAIAQLNEQYEASGRSFRIEQVAGGYQMLTLPQYGQLLNELHRREIDSKLTRSALETLSIIAYKQPVLRAEVEAIRGVASGETIRTLMEKHLVKIAGRAEIPGRPILYGTTKRFLEVFGLNSLKELPKEDQTRPHPPHKTAAAPHTPEHSVEAETRDEAADAPAAPQEAESPDLASPEAANAETANPEVANRAAEPVAGGE